MYQPFLSTLEDDSREALLHVELAGLVKSIIDEPSRSIAVVLTDARAVRSSL